jgi:hypothetical protein
MATVIKLWTLKDKQKTSFGSDVPCEDRSAGRSEELLFSGLKRLLKT